MRTENENNLQFLSPKLIWNLAVIASIQTVHDVCEEDYKLTTEDGQRIENCLRILMFSDDELNGI